MYFLNHYVIDWEKVKTLDDIKRILKALDIGFEPNNPNVDAIMDLVNLQNKPHVKIGHE